MYHNRLKLGMPLQCDPTVIYALMLARPVERQPPRAGPADELAVQHLPVSRACRRSDRVTWPRLARGRVRPADVPYLYFVSRNDGTHVFASTLAEHNRNVSEWQVKYFKDMDMH